MPKAQKRRSAKAGEGKKRKRSGWNASKRPWWWQWWSDDDDGREPLVCGVDVGEINMALLAVGLESNRIVGMSMVNLRKYKNLKRITHLTRKELVESIEKVYHEDGRKFFPSGGRSRLVVIEQQRIKRYQRDQMKCVLIEQTLHALSGSKHTNVLSPAQAKELFPDDLPIPSRHLSDDARHAHNKHFAQKLMPKIFPAPLVRLIEKEVPAEPDHLVDAYLCALYALQKKAEHEKTAFRVRFADGGDVLPSEPPPPS